MSKFMKSLREYNFPEDLKKMNNEQLSLLTYSIRDFLIDNISETGGHLASNLGVVELSIALHKIFDSPKDKIIWDVGHQSYVHKILTGRMDGFKTLRQFKGMSGFPKRNESEHDIYDTGHASVSISAAAGMAAARDIKGEDHSVIAVIGDGSLTGGLAYEGLNNLGISKSKVIVILNDNGMSISSNVGGVSNHLNGLRASSGYKIAKNTVKSTIDKIPYIGKSIHGALGEAKDRLKYAMVPKGVIFEELGITYLGPIDGHDINDLTHFLSQAKNIEGPVLIHVITKKGKGYREAERNPDKYHGIGSFDINTGMEKKKSGATYSKAFGETLFSLAASHADIVAISAAMCDATGLGKFAQKYPSRFFDVGIAEAHGVSFASGLAINGLKPYVAIYSSFLQRGYDQIVEDVALQNLPVVFALDRAGIVGADGETHHGILDLSYLMPIPNMTVFAPATGRELKDIVEKSYEMNHPVAIRYPRGEYDEKNKYESILSGDNTRLSQGKDGDIIAVGAMLYSCEKACEILKNKGYDMGLIHAVVLKGEGEDIPLSDEENKLIITVEDNYVIGGYGSYLQNKTGKPVLTIGWPDKFIEHGDCNSLYEKYMLDSWGIAERIMREIERKA